MIMSLLPLQDGTLEKLFLENVWYAHNMTRSLVCLDRSGTWPVGNWNSPWLDTSAQCVVWRSAVAAPTCSPVEKTSKSSVGIWSTTRYDERSVHAHPLLDFWILLTMSICVLGHQALPRTPQCCVWFRPPSNYRCAGDMQQRCYCEGKPTLCMVAIEWMISLIWRVTFTGSVSVLRRGFSLWKFYSVICLYFQFLYSLLSIMSGLLLATIRVFLSCVMFSKHE